MNIRHILAALLLMVTGVITAQQMPPTPIDPDVRIGKLDNGLTYYVRHNNWPEHRVNFYIAQRVGSIQEEESQRGLAHFLEHMAFNGTENFPGNGVIDYTRSLGCEFGGDLNAYTSIDRTVYRIDNVPSTRQSALDSCLLILRDWSCGLLLEGDEIDKERGVIHEEWRLRSSASQRLFERNLPTLYPGSKYGLRMPIGLMDVIDNFKYDELRNYYRKWYRPDNQAIIVVGDIDVDYTEAKIKEMFGPIKLAENAVPVVDEPVPDTPEPIVVVDKDKEMTMSYVDILFKHDATKPDEKYNLDYMLEKYLIGMAVTMLDKRLDEIAQQPDCPFVQAGAEDGQYIFAKTKDCFELSAIPKEGRHAEALQVITEEALRAGKYGFTATEYDRARTEFLSDIEKRYNNRNQTKNTTFGNAYTEHFLENEPIPSIEQEYQLWNQLAPMIPVDVVNEVMPMLIPANDSNIVIINFNPEKDGYVIPAADDLLAALNTARGTELTAYVDNVKNEPLMAEMPKKGKIEKAVVSDKFGYKELTLSNGATVILKHTDFKDDEVKFKAESKGGSSLYGEKDRANLEIFDIAMAASGLGNFDNTELQKALAGKQVELGLELSTSYERLEGHSTVKDLETLFQLNYLYFTNIHKDQKSYDRYVNLLSDQLKNKGTVPEMAFSDSLSYTLGNHTWRSIPLDEATLKAADYDRMLAIAKERTANAGDFTFYIVGNYDEATIDGFIEQYIASLPGKKGKGENYKNVDERPTGHVINQFTRTMETPKATAVMYWYTDKVPFSLENDVKAGIAGDVLDMVWLKKIREDASAAYTVTGRGGVQRVGDKCYTQLLAYCPMQPEKADIALDILRAEVPAMVNSIDGDYLTKVKEQLLNTHETNLKDNDYWMRAIGLWHNDKVDIVTDYVSLVNRLTAGDISAFVRDVILPAGNTVEVIMLPQQ